MGPHCEQALCFPQCMNGGNCTAPAVCSCPKGFQGRYCEGGKFKNTFISLFLHKKLHTG